MTLVAIIEQDPGFAAELRTAVESAGFHTDWFREARTALEDVRRNAFSLAIIDLDLHGVDPFAVCREASRVIPVIAITASRGEEVCLRALEAGADDCVTRPFSARELAARCRNLLRRAGTSSSTDELSVAISAMRVRSGDETRALSRGEAEILAILASSRGRPLTALELLERLPTHSQVKRGTVESRIKSLRKKLGPGRLLTRGRLGYELAD
ncbi:MAG TPA: response regulator transcription factor [Thermoanaerobaculia bacterium]|nr:response regulator transcription factor [Thermoanaerobaculia bacterium]